MFKILLKQRLSSLFYALFAGEKKHRSIPMLILLGVLFAYLACVLLGLFGLLFFFFGIELFAAGAAHAYFGLGGALLLLLILFGSVILTKNQLYVANDNELLLSMPIPPHLILLSRLAFLLISDYLLGALVSLPLLLAYLLFGTVTVGGVLLLLLSLLLLPLVAQAITCLLSLLVARLEGLFRKKVLFSLLFSLFFLGIYFLFVFGMEDFIEPLLADITPLILFVDGFLPLAVLGRAMAGSFLDFLLFFVPALLLTALVFFLLSRTYLRTILEKRNEARSIYREKKQKGRSPLKALTMRELAHFFSSSGYMLNTGMGLLFTLPLSVLLLINRSTVLSLSESLPFLGDLLPAAVAAALSFVLSLSYFTASAVSLEGAALWIVRTSPVPTRTILLSKLCFHLVLTLPILLPCTVVAAVAVEATVLEWALMFLFCVAFLLFVGLLGLISNLLFPKLVWKNELVPIKQGFSSLVTMVGGFLSASLFGGGATALALILPTAAALALATLPLLLASAFLFGMLFNWGVRRFEELTVS